MFRPIILGRKSDNLGNFFSNNLFGSLQVMLVFI
jgi:hypothetical protein